MRFYKIDELGGRVIDIPNKYEAINEAWGLNHAWNTPTLQIGGKKFIVICSDVGKVKHLPISCISKDDLINPKSTIREPFIVGPVIITKFDGIDDFTDLTELDIVLLNNRLIDAKFFGLESYGKILVLD